MANALDSMPDKKLGANALSCADGVCALGAVARHKGLDVELVDPQDVYQVTSLFDVASALIQEIEFENDQDFYGSDETPEVRWKRMRKWVDENLTELAPKKGGNDE